MRKSPPKVKFTGKAKEFLALNSYINILDNKKVVIENCKQILECNEILARVLTKTFLIEIWGSGLSLSNYCTECVEVSGTIESVALSARRKRREN